MLRHLQLAITAVILVTSIIGFPAAENPISYTYQLMSMQKAYQGNEVTLSLLEKLISMMNASTAAAGVASDIAYGAAGASDGQAIPNIDNCISSILSSDQVEDIQFQQSGLLYIIINGQLVISRRPLDLYIKLSRIVSRMVGITSMIDVWFSHTPCAHCIDYLDMLFGSFTVKPILHVESLRYNGSNYDIIRDLGCLAKLSTKEFHLKPWDWSIFSAKYGLSCDYYSTAKHSTEYKTQKNYTETLLVFLEKNFTRSALVDLCE